LAPEKGERTDFPLRQRLVAPHRLSELAEILGVPIAGGDPEVVGVAPLERAGGKQIGFLADRRYLPHLSNSQAGALLVAESLSGSEGVDSRPRIVASDPHLALLQLIEIFHPLMENSPEVHPTAILGRGVRLGERVQIGPYAVLEAGVSVGKETKIGAHCVIGAGSQIGQECLLHPHVVLYPGSRLRDRVIAHSGVRIGSDGFGYTFREGVHAKVPQVGGCDIGDDVEIGANSTIDRGSIGDTVLRGGTKLDNMVHVGHNVEIGELSILTAQVAIAGSTKIGRGVQVGGQAGVGGHLVLGDGAKVSAKAGVITDVPAGATFMGFPARPRIEFLRSVAAHHRLAELRERIVQLELRLPPEEKGSP